MYWTYKRGHVTDDDRLPICIPETKMIASLIVTECTDILYILMDGLCEYSIRTSMNVSLCTRHKTVLRAP